MHFFWGRALLPPSLKRGSTLHQPAHEQILDHRHKCTCLMKPGEETYLDILAGSASVGSWVWHNSWGNGEEQRCSRWSQKKKNVKNKQNTQKIHRIFNSNHFANPTGAISEAQHVQRRICNLYPAVTSWSERRAQVLEARMQEKTQLNDDFNWQFVAHDQRELLPRDLVWRGREHSLPRFTWVVSEQAFTALFRPF